MDKSIEERVIKSPMGFIYLEETGKIKYDNLPLLLKLFSSINLARYLMKGMATRKEKVSKLRNRLPYQGVIGYIEEKEGLCLGAMITRPQTSLKHVSDLYYAFEGVAKLKGIRKLITKTHISQRLMDKMGWEQIGTPDIFSNKKYRKVLDG